MNDIKNQYPDLYKTDLRLDSARSVRQLLGRVVNMRLREQIDSDTARDVGYLCNIMLQAFKVGDLEEKIIELEDYLNIKQVI